MIKIVKELKSEPPGNHLLFTLNIQGHYFYGYLKKFINKDI
jgi:hypothetical protein